ncbi:MAG: hypothetical protein WCX81_06450, partial [Monoglobales bacterium]
VKIMPSVTSNSGGDMNIMLTNASFDDSGKLKCIIRSDKAFYILTQEGEFVPSRQEKTDKGTVVTIENIKPWDYILLTNITF